MSFVIICVLSGILLLSITAITLALLAVRASKQAANRFEFALTQQATLIQALQAKLELSDSGFQGMGKRLTEFEKRLCKTVQKAESIETRDPQAAAYGHAVKLVQRGAAIEDIVRSCGLSRSEAELVKALQSQMHAEPARAAV